jgi:hypothetical protein
MLGPEQVTTRLEQAGVEYCVVGGLASIAYGRPRLTLDADVVAAINPENISDLIEAFQPADFYLPPAFALGNRRGLVRATRVGNPSQTCFL